MLVTLLDYDFTQIADLEVIGSLIWNEKYSEHGDFELVTLASSYFLDNLRINRYLSLATSDTVMVIEKIRIDSNMRNGNRIIVSGRYLESILKRRVLPAQKTFNGNFQSAVLTLLNENIINPSIIERKITNFVFNSSTDTAITSLTLSEQFSAGDILYDVISKICQANSVGFKIELIDNATLSFSLYAGKNRSYDQTANSFVIFSSDFENMISSEYANDITSLGTQALVKSGKGGGVDFQDPTYTYINGITGSISGIQRREIFLDESSVSAQDDTGTDIPLWQYLDYVNNKAAIDLYMTTFTEKFEGEMDAAKIFVYGTDFFMGDIVQVADEYGHEGKARVIGLLRSEEPSGIKVLPAFNAIF